MAETGPRPPDLEQSKAAVLNSLTSASRQRRYDHAIREFVAWYCSEPRLAFTTGTPDHVASMMAVIAWHFEPDLTLTA
jgi:hypothetical protein